MEYLHFEERVITSNWELRKMESHPYYEIYILLKGQRVLFLNNRMISVPESSILVIPPFMPHRTSGGAYHRINIWVSPSLLDKENIDFLESHKVPTVFTLNPELCGALYSVLSSASSFKEDEYQNALKYKKSFFNIAFYYLKQCSICTDNALSDVKQEEKLLLPILTYINIGMDEAHTVGLGKYLDKYGYQDKTSILSKHLERVIQIAQKYAFKPTMWSDMFIRPCHQGEYYPVVPDFNALKKQRDKIPEDIKLCYWDYENKAVERYDTMFSVHNCFGS